MSRAPSIILGSLILAGCVTQPPPKPPPPPVPPSPSMVAKARVLQALASSQGPYTNQYSNIIVEEAVTFQLPYAWPPGQTNFHWDLQQSGDLRRWSVLLSNLPSIYSATDTVVIMYPLGEGYNFYRLSGHP